MRVAITAIILTCVLSCSEKRNNRVDPVVSSARNLLSIGPGDERALEMLRNLESEIDRAKHRAAADTKGLPSYDAAVETFHRSLQQRPKSEELWRTAIEQLHRAQLERLGLRMLTVPSYYDPPMRNPYPIRNPNLKGIR